MATMRLMISFVFLLCSSLCMAEEDFTFQQVIEKARLLSASNFQEVSDQKVPNDLKQIGYDQWRDIRFKPSESLWANDPVPFKVQFFHLGFLYTKPVLLHYIDHAGTHDVPFSKELFTYGKSDLGGKVPADLGFSGLRIHYPINNKEHFDEVAVFQGASYFRAVAKDILYGLSARAVAVNTAMESGEEFPFLKEFWIVKPEANGTQITLYALLDSPSISGAYKFIIQPGEETVMQVKSVLFIRKKIDKLGIAPMTTMFWYGENTGSHKDDFRPEVHDSDGLLILSKSGEWIWRPFSNPSQLSINSFQVDTPQGFGVLQRDLNFDHYQDLEARYEVRPSIWISPVGDWGKGHVELIQIPTGNEYNENVNAFWVPDKTIDAGQRLNFSYTMEWCSSKLKRFSKGYVTDTRVVPQQDRKTVKFIIDFQGVEISRMTEKDELTAQVDISKGYKLAGQQLIKNPVTQGWRMVFDIKEDQGAPLEDLLPGKRPPVELRALIKKGAYVVTETWSYTF